MKKKSITNKIFIIFVLSMYIFSFGGMINSNAEEGEITIEKKENDTLIFHDYNEYILQNYFTEEDYARIVYNSVPEEWIQKFMNEPHEEIYGTNNLAFIYEDYEVSHELPEDYEPIEQKVFDIKRKLDSKLISTTFADGGYDTVLKVNNNATRLIEAGSSVDGVTCDINGEFISNGNYIKVDYVVKNNNSSACKISLATFSDIQIGVNDSASVNRQPDGSGIVMTDTTTNLQFKFFGRNVEGVTNIDTLWIGAYPYQALNFFDNNDVDDFSGYDSAFAYSWKDRTIESGETQVYSVLYGVDELSAIPVVTLNKGLERYTSENAEVTGIITDLNDNDTGKIYFNVDNGDQIYLGRYNLVNNKYNFSIDLSKMALADGVYKVKVWAIDESGLISSVVEKDVVIGANTPIPEPKEEKVVNNVVPNNTVNNIVNNRVNNIVNNRVTPKNENTVNNVVPQTTNNVTKTDVDNTMAAKTLPYTGFGEKAMVLIFFTLIIARVVYVKYKKIQF